MFLHRTAGRCVDREELPRTGAASTCYSCRGPAVGRGGRPLGTGRRRGRSSARAALLHARHRLFGLLTARRREHRCGVTVRQRRDADTFTAVPGRDEFLRRLAPEELGSWRSRAAGSSHCFRAGASIFALSTSHGSLQDWARRAADRRRQLSGRRWEDALELRGLPSRSCCVIARLTGGGSLPGSRRLIWRSLRMRRRASARRGTRRGFDTCAARRVWSAAVLRYFFRPTRLVFSCGAH